jgi:myosin heavy subunit
MDMFRGCKPEDMPPHVYAIAQSAYDALKTTRRDQAIVLSGYSNSGKTVNVKHIVYYLQHTATALHVSNRVITGEYLPCFLVMSQEPFLIVSIFIYIVYLP